MPAVHTLEAGSDRFLVVGAPTGPQTVSILKIVDGKPTGERIDVSVWRNAKPDHADYEKFVVVQNGHVYTAPATFFPQRGAAVPEFPAIMADVYRAFRPKIATYELAQAHLAKLQAWLRVADDDDIRHSLCTQIAQVETDVNKAWQARNWVTATVRPFADLVAAHLGGVASVGGPYGIGARCAITISEASDDLETTDDTDLLYFEVDSIGDFDQADWRLGIIDLTREIRSYGANSIGRLNGLQFGSRPLEPHFDMSDVVDMAVACGWSVKVEAAPDASKASDDAGDEADTAPAP